MAASTTTKWPTNASTNGSTIGASRGAAAAAFGSKRPPLPPKSRTSTGAVAAAAKAGTGGNTSRQTTGGRTSPTKSNGWAVGRNEDLPSLPARGRVLQNPAIAADPPSLPPSVTMSNRHRSPSHIAASRAFTKTPASVPKLPDMPPHFKGALGTRSDVMVLGSVPGNDESSIPSTNRLVQLFEEKSSPGLVKREARAGSLTSRSTMHSTVSRAMVPRNDPRSRMQHLEARWPPEHGQLMSNNSMGSTDVYSRRFDGPDEKMFGDVVRAGPMIDLVNSRKETTTFGASDAANVQSSKPLPAPMSETPQQPSHPIPHQLVRQAKGGSLVDRSASMSTTSSPPTSRQIEATRVPQASGRELVLERPLLPPIAASPVVLPPSPPQSRNTSAAPIISPPQPRRVSSASQLLQPQPRRSPASSRSPPSVSLNRRGSADRRSTTSIDSLRPQLTADSLADAMVAGSLATRHATRVSSRASSPGKPLHPNPYHPLPPLPPSSHQSSKGSAMSMALLVPQPTHSQSASRTQSPAKGTTLRPTMRSNPAKTLEDEERRGRHHILKKHPQSQLRDMDVITPTEKKRYEGVWAANRTMLVPRAELDPDGTGVKQGLLRPRAADEVHGYVVRDIWSRSGLGEHCLAQIWALVDGGGAGQWGAVTEKSGRGRLDREEFVVGMWLIDQCLKGRKLPVAKVPQGVWASVRTLGGLEFRR